jgi:hypothetical protein
LSEENGSNRSIWEPAAREAEEVFTQVVSKHAKEFSGTLANRAKNELYDLQHLWMGKAAPHIEAVDTEGKDFRLSEYRGQVVVLTFFDKAEEVAYMENDRRKWLLEKWADQPVSVLNVDLESSAESLTKLIQEGQVKRRCIWEPEQGPIAKTWNVHSWPVTYVLDRRGIIQYRHLRDTELLDAVSALLQDVKPKSR